MKKLLLSAVLVAASGVFAGSNRHVTPTADGDLLGEDGKPAFLISTSVKIDIFDTNYEKNYPLFKDYPEWLYGKGYAPAKYPLFEKIGFNALNFFGTTLSLRALAPDYRFNKESQLADAREFIRKYGLENLGKRAHLPSEKALREHDELVVNASGIPVYLDLHPALQTIVTSRREEVRKLLSPEKYFAAPDQHPVFALRFKLCDSEARELQKRLYVDQARHYLSLGIRPFVYKLYNEADYKDYSPENFRAFAAEMRTKYGSIGKLNTAWHTAYSSFDEIAVNPGGLARDIEFRKFLERQIADFTGELRDALRAVDPGAEVLSQVHSGAWRANWNNFNQYLINRHTGYVSFGTGNCTLDAGVDADESAAFGECGSNNSPREMLARTAFYRGLADGKPLLNTEAYIAGFGDRYRSFKKAFWHEMVQGSSMMNLWVWGGYWAPWIAPNINYMLYHPKCVTPESWRAIPETLREFSRTADFFQRRANRPKASVAALFSYPTLRANPDLTDGFIQGINILLLRNIPADAIFEEQLPENRQNRYRAVIALGVRNVSPDTGKLLRKFVAEGGTLITDAGSLRHDEYDFFKTENLLAGLSVSPGSGKLLDWEKRGIRFIDSESLSPLPEKWRVLEEYRGKTLLAERKFGKGAIVVLTGKWQDCALSQLLAPVFDRLDLKPTATVRKFDADDLSPYVGALKAAHDGMTAWYFVNYTNRPKLIRVSADEFRNAVAVDFLNRCSYPVMGDTVVLLIPEQYHLVMVTGEKTKVEKEFGIYDSVTPEMQKKNFDRQLEERTRNAYTRPSAPVDIRAAANYGFDNQQGWDVPTAWFDETKRDLPGVPWHGQVFHCVNFDLIRFDFNGNRTCIALKSKFLPDAPESSKEIALNAKLRGVAFLHAVTHGKPGEVAMTYLFTYEDGSSVEVPIVVGQDVGDWNIAGNTPEMRKKCAWKSQGGYGFFQYEWNNPQPSKTLKSVVIRSGGGESVPIVTAVSALPTRFGKEYPNRIDLARVMTDCTAKKSGDGIQPDGSLRFNQENYAISTHGKQPISLPKEKIDSAVLRFQMTVLPDSWGNPVFSSNWWGTGLRGISGSNAKAETWPDSRLTRVAEAFTNAFRSVESYAVPVEVEVGLGIMNEANGTPFDAIYGIQLAPGSNRVTIRDLRIEY